MRDKRKRFLMLAYYRKKYNLTQAELAELINIAGSSYSHKETGRTPFSFDEMAAIHKVLNEKASEADDGRLTLDEIFLT